ncbi:hypothetical protein [Serratia sp. DD3]|uniref:hypothetical protein n=1 Tax=Serratia sp. DD3 TaxID=1410619 RepID=UPI0004DA9688|nr:hypothetical protein [Serratia sp. DD3]KEY59379.1 hypothetical protein SRDD_16620 [Serratia sp. DD3]
MMNSKNYESHRKAIVSKGIPSELLARITDSDIQVINTFLTRIRKLELTPQEKNWVNNTVNAKGL